MMKRILVVDDDPMVCKVISRVLASKGMQPTVATGGAEALECLTKQPFEAVVLDIRMDDIDGFDVLEQIRATGNDVPVIILSADNENYSMLLGLESGADDYMTKPFDPTFLAAKIDALIRRERKHSAAASALECGNLRYDPAARSLVRGDEEISLSAKEHALIALFMENPGKVFSKDELYNRIWGEGRNQEKSDDNTVMVHINRLRGKIEPDPRNPRHILTVWGIGYKLGAG